MHTYFIIMRGSTKDVTALAELGMGTPDFQHKSTQHWPQYDQMGLTFSTDLDRLGLLVNLLSRGKIIWFSVK